MALRTGQQLFCHECGVDPGSRNQAGSLSPRLLPESRMQEYKRPAKTIPRSPGHHQEWINACKGGPPAGSNFDVAGPLTELVQLGNVAIRAGQRNPENGRVTRIDWDSANLKVTNVPEANKFLQMEYRKGWTL